MNPSIQEFQRIVHQTPDLGLNGFIRRPHPPTPEEREAEKRPLLDHFDAFVACCRWLQAREFNKTVNRNARSSNGLKDSVQGEVRYVPNGAFIAAVLYLDLPHREYPDSPDVFLNIKKSSSPLG